MSEASPAAQLATRIWDTCRQEVLKGHDWPFATAVTALSTATYTLVTNDWDYAYVYPTTALEVWHVYYLASDRNQAFRVIYDPVTAVKIILSNTASAVAEYTYDLNTPTLYDAHFVSVLSYFLAANMAKPLTGDSDLAKKMLDMYNAYMSDAERMSSYEAGGPATPQSAFVDAREGSTLSTEDHYVAVRHPNG
jgi:hypothetical protein